MGAPVLCASVNAQGGIIAGTEMRDHVSRVCVWDGRVVGEKPTWVFAESHGDDVSFVGFARGEEGRRWGVSGGMDGLVNVFDLLAGMGAGGEDDDEKALWQVVNVGASVHRAGFLNASSGSGGDAAAAGKGEWVFGISTDESLVLRSFNHIPGGGEEEDAEGEVAGDVGDVRRRLDCEYVVDVLRAGSTGTGGIVVAGNKEVGKQRVDLVPLRWTSGGQWGLMSEDKVRLQGGHGEEVCRGVWVDEEVGFLFFSFFHVLVCEEESRRVLMGDSPRRFLPVVRMGLSRFGGRRRVEGRAYPKGRKRRGRGRGRRRRRGSNRTDSLSENIGWIALARIGVRYGKPLLASQSGVYTVPVEQHGGDYSCEVWDMGAAILQANLQERSNLKYR